jgi:lambda repressor-like predicted transcriptional regulator
VKTSLINYLLTDKGTTHERISNAIGVSRNAVSMVIRGETKSEKIERAIALVLELPVQDVFPSRYDARGLLLPRTRRQLNRHYSPQASLAALQSELARMNKVAA